MIRNLHPDDIALIPHDAATLPQAQQYLATLESHIPGLDLTWDRALAIGYLAAREIRAGRWEEHRALALLTFDDDEFDTLALAAVTLLDPGPLPEPFATWAALSRVATSPDAAAKALAAPRLS